MTEPYLPLVSYPFTEEDYKIYDLDKEHVYSEKRRNYELLTALITVLTDADCWAITVAGDGTKTEILFNNFDPNRSIRERIIDDTVREKISEDPHKYLLSHVRDDSLVRIYMYTDDTWTLNINYAKADKTYYLSYCKQKY